MTLSPELIERKNWSQRLLREREISVFVLLIFTLIVVGAINPAFLAVGNLRDLLMQSVPTIIVACGLTLVIVLGEIDISMGSMMGLLATVMGLLTSPSRVGLSVGVGVVSMLALGAGLGLLNGLLVTVGRMPSIIVTLAMLTIGKIDPVKAGGYIVSQVAGAIIGALVLKIAFPADLVEAAKLGTPLLAANATIGGAIIVEAITTFALVSVIMGTVVDGRAPKLGALFIGLTVTLDILCIGTLTGAAMNPARSIGPAIVSGNLENFWVYWIGPIIGGIAGAVLYQGVMAHKEQT